MADVPFVAPIALFPPNELVLLRRFADLSPDMFCICGFDGCFHWVSPRWEAVLGWGAEELTSRAFLEFVHPDDVQATLAVLAHMQEEGVDVQFFENRYQHRSGAWRWLQWNATLAQDGIYAVARDVTQQHSPAQRPQEQEHLLAFSAQMAGIGYWRFLLAPQRLTWSAHVPPLLGLPQDTTPSLAILAAQIPPDDRARALARIHALIAARESFSLEQRIVRADAAERLIEVRGRCELGGDGAVVSLFGVLRDVTDERQAQHRLLRSERLATLGALVAGVSHEINTPLVSVKNSLELLDEALARHASAEVVDLLKTALLGAHQIVRVVAGLRGLGRETSVVHEPVDLLSVLERAVVITANEIRHHARLRQVISRAPPVLADPVRLTQVLINLLVNAAQAMPIGHADRHTILLRLDTDPRGWARVTVEDNGHGIPADFMPSLFVPFSTTKDTGTGLGLAISRDILHELGGTLKAESLPGHTLFTLCLPPALSSSPPSTAPPAPAPPPPPSSPADPSPEGGEKDRLHIVVVDDDVLVGRTLERVLRHHTVTLYTSSTVALRALLHGEPPDVIISDLLIPDLPGWELYATLQAQRPALARRLMFITGGVSSPEVQAFLSACPQPCLDKPFDLREVRQQVERLAQRSG